MEVRVLRYFLAVAREQSISGAAKFLHVTQPTLSRQLQDLEQELGTRLMVRGSRRITLTPEGMLLRRRAQEIVDLVDRTEDEVRTSDHDVKGVVNIGTGPTEGVGALVKAAQRLRRDHPGITFSLIGGSSADTIERIDSGVVDFGMLAEGAEPSKLESLRLPTTETWGVLVRGEDELAAHEAVRAEQLRRRPLILARDQEWRHSIRKWIGTRRDNLDIVACYDYASNAKTLAREGLGVVLVTDGQIGDLAEGSGLRFVPLEPAVTMGVMLAWKKHHGFSRASQLFLDAVRREVARELAAAA